MRTIEVSGVARWWAVSRARLTDQVLGPIYREVMPATPHHAQPSSTPLTIDDDAGGRPHLRVAPATRAQREDASRPYVAPLAAITATGGAVAAIVTVGLAAVLDALISPGLGVLFGFVFILTSVLIALRLGWYDAWAAIALPPLVFVAAAGLAAQVAPVTTGSWVHRTSSDIAAAVLDHPIYLLLGTLLAAAAIMHRARVE